MEVARSGERAGRSAGSRPAHHSATPISPDACCWKRDTRDPRDQEWIGNAKKDTAVIAV